MGNPDATPMDSPGRRDTKPAAAALPVRIRHVDSLRAVAAGLVVWSHLAEALGPLSSGNPAFLAFLSVLPPALNLGRVGVILFFAVSGFVICRSFGGPPEGRARRFLIKRCCRLYPAFAVSLPGGMLVWWLWGEPFTWRLLAANATMAPQLFGQQPLLGLYWTLEIELLFYAVCLGLHGLGGLQSGAVWWGGAAGLTLLPRILHKAGLLIGLHYHVSGYAFTCIISLAVMFWGAYFRLVYDATGGFRRAPFTHAGTWWLVLLTLVLIHVPDPRVTWALLRGSAPWPEQVVIVAPLLIFALWVAWLRVDNVVLTFLGVISYSLYLFHPIVLHPLARAMASRWAGHRLDTPLWVSLLVCAGLSTLLAAGMYRWVEKPGIAFGKRWAAAVPRG